MAEPPRRIYWEITKRCNLRCAHCRAMPQACAPKDDLSVGEAVRLIDAIAEVGRCVLVLTGGEPLLRRDLFDLARYGAWRGLTMALATNGTLITHETARAIVDAGFKRVSISLDGPDALTHDAFRRVTGAFDAAVDGLIRLKELGVPVQVNTTVTVHNQDQLEEMYELVRKLGANAWHLFLLVPVGCGLEIAPDAQLTAREYEETLYWIDEVAEREAQRGTMDVRAICAPHAQRIRLQRREAQGQSSVMPTSRQGCLAGISMCFVSYCGEVFPCGYLPVAAGDIRRQPFGAIWASAPIFAELRDPNRLEGKCGACEYRTICGGCRARAFGQTNRYLGEEPFCNYLPKPIALDA